MGAVAWRPLPECGDVRLPGPFPFGFADDYLPEDLLTNLEGSFLDPATHPGLEVLGRGKKRLVFRAPPVPDLVAGAGPWWVEAVSAVSSPAFIVPTWEWVRSILRDIPVPPGPYADLVGERMSLSADDLIVQLEFSSLEAGAYLPPHTDAADKVASLVFYLPGEGWRTAWGGVTEVYGSADEQAGPNWNNRIGSRDQMRLLDTVPFARNRVFWFVKTADSWHGVSPVTAPAGHGRRSFNVSLAISPEALARPALAALAKRVAELEGGEGV